MYLLFGFLFLIFSISGGILLLYRAIKARGVVLFFFGSLVGIVSISWITYLLALFFASMGAVLPISASLPTVFMLMGLALAGLVLFFRKKLFCIFSICKDAPHRWIIALIFLALSASLMLVTFRYDRQNQIVLTDRFIYSDFASHIPLIRSFSLGENIPAEKPLFAGEPIRYHFLFYFFAGLLERAGLPLDFALNIPSIIGFAGLLVAIWYFAQVIFKGEKGSLLVGLLSCFLFITSSSLLAFTSFSLPPSLTLAALVKSTVGATEFLNGGPYYNWDGTITGLFWNLNIFTNQRHFGFGLAYGLFILSFLIMVLQKKEASPKTTFYRIVFLAVLMGLLPSVHIFAFTSLMLIILLLLPFLPRKKHTLFFLIVAGLIFLPQLLNFSSPSTENYPVWFPGYALHGNLGLQSFAEYWFKNLGLKSLLLPVLFIALRGLPFYVLLASMGIFLFANFFRVTPDIWVNHKFFNIWLVFVDVAAAYFIVKFFLIKQDWSLKIAGGAAIFVLTISGLLDMPPIFNTSYVQINDWQRDPIASFIVLHTQPNEVIATGYNVYNPATLTGRSIMLGWPYFVGGTAESVRQREEVVRQLFETQDPKVRCQIASAYNINYIIVGKSPYETDPYRPDSVLLSAVLGMPVAEDDRYIIFDIQPACKNYKLVGN